MASPLLTYANNVLSAANTAKTAADAAVTAAKTNLKTAQTTLGQKTQDLGAALKVIADIRAQLALISTTDDGTALLTQLNAAIIDARAKQAAALAAEDAVAAATSEAAKASAVLGDIGARLAGANAALAQITTDEAARQVLRTAGGSPPLSTLKANATAALSAAPFTTADARLNTDLPVKLRGRADAGFDREATLVIKRQDVDNAAEAAIGNKLSAVEKQQRKLADAQARLSDYVLNARQRFDQAIVLLTRVADPSQGSLTSDEIKSIQSENPDGTPNAALKTARETVADAAKDVDAAQKTLDDDKAKVDIAILNALAADIDADPELDAGVIAARAAAAASTTNLTNKQNAYAAATPATLRAWEAAVPDATFQLLADFHTANQLLTKLSTDDPATLIANLDTAETDLVTALTAADKAARTLNRLREESAKDSSLAEAAANAAPRRTFSALRGDFE